MRGRAHNLNPTTRRCRPRLVAPQERRGVRCTGAEPGRGDGPRRDVRTGWTCSDAAEPTSAAVGGSWTWARDASVDTPGAAVPRSAGVAFDKPGAPTLSASPGPRDPSHARTSSASGGSVVDVDVGQVVDGRGTGCDCGPRLIARDRSRPARCRCRAGPWRRSRRDVSPGWECDAAALPSSAVMRGRHRLVRIRRVVTLPARGSTVPSQRSSRPTGHRPDRGGSRRIRSDVAGVERRHRSARSPSRPHHRRQEQGPSSPATTISSPPNSTVHTVCGNSTVNAAIRSTPNGTDSGLRSDRQRPAHDRACHPCRPAG